MKIELYYYYYHYIIIIIIIIGHSVNIIESLVFYKGPKKFSTNYSLLS